jgi:ABC-type arginine transport system ATPase subunit
MKIRFHLHATVGGRLTQMALWPTMFVTHNKISRNVRLVCLSASIFFWDLGFTVEWSK